MNFIRLFKSNAGFVVALLIIGILAFNPGLKALVLRGLLKTGLFGTNTSVIPDKTSGNSASAKIAPVQFRDTGGALVSLADLKGKVIFLNFWATWCPPCLAEMPSINALYNKFKNNKEAVFILADADNDLKKSSAFMQKNRYNLPLYAPASFMPEELFSGNLPTTIIIDKHGEVVFRHEGMANYDSKEMEDFIKTLSK